MNGIVIRSKTRNFVISQLDGFDEFQNDDKLVDMGIVTNDFVSSLIQFIEKEFHITISGYDGKEFRNNNLSIKSIGKFIEKRLSVEGEGDKKMSGNEIDRDSIFYNIKSCIMNIFGRIALDIEDNEDIRKKSFWDELETELPGELLKKLKIKIDLSKLKPLTLNKIADAIIETGIFRESNGSGKADEITILKEVMDLRKDSRIDI
jgi:acyl carrier protein